MNKNTKIVIIVGLVVAVAALSVAYAVLQQSLSINSTATVASGSWDVGFQSASGECTVATNANNTSNPATGTWTADNSASPKAATVTVALNLPGDSVTCDIPIANTGDINAVLTTFNTGSDAYAYTAGGTVAAADQALVSSTVSYLDSSKAEVTTPVNSSLAATTGVAYVRVVYTYPSDKTALPTKEMTVSRTISLTYEQA